MTVMTVMTVMIEYPKFWALPGGLLEQGSNTPVIMPSNGDMLGPLDQGSKVN